VNRVLRLCYERGDLGLSADYLVRSRRPFPCTTVLYVGHGARADFRLWLGTRVDSAELIRYIDQFDDPKM
jgi:hypothetical protein